MEYVKNSFYVDKKISTCIIDGRVSENIESYLNEIGIKTIKTPKCLEVYDAISYHPDIQFFNCGNGKIIVSPNVYEEYLEILKDYKLEIIKGERKLNKKYPKDIAYNVCIVGKYAIHNFKYTDDKVLKYIEEKGYEKINVNQGYSKCSICVVDNNSIITSDKGIVNSIKESGACIECLLIENGDIDLFDMDFGFIGGCSGNISKKEIAFLGNIEKHSDFRIIKEFLERKNKKIVSLSKNKLIDLGSIIPIAY